MNTLEMVMEKLNALGKFNFNNLEGAIVRAFGNYEFEGESYIKIQTEDNKSFKTFVDHENAPVIAFEIEHAMDNMIKIYNVREV